MTNKSNFGSDGKTELDDLLEQLDGLRDRDDYFWLEQNDPEAMQLVMKIVSSGGCDQIAERLRRNRKYSWWTDRVIGAARYAQRKNREDDD